MSYGLMDMLGGGQPAAAPMQGMLAPAPQSGDAPPGGLLSYVLDLLRQRQAMPQMADATNPHVMTPGAIPGFAGSRAGPPMQPLPPLDRNVYPDALRNGNTLYPRRGI